MKAYPIMLCVLSAQLVVAQHEQHQPSSDVAIDGAINPERISELTAVLMYFRSLAGPEAPDAVGPARLTAQLRPIGLSPADEQQLRDALAAFRSSYLQLKTKTSPLVASIQSTGSAEVTRQYQSIKQQFQTSAFALYSATLAKMSQQGQVRLRMYVLDLRKNMKVIAQPKM
jgi:hypothetical protein